MNHISKIIIIGTSHHNTLSMVRCMGEEGRSVVLYIYGTQSSYITSSIYVDKALFFVSASEAVDFIASTHVGLDKKMLVIACSDEVASLMDLRYEELSTRCYFFNAGTTGRITYFMDKQRQLDLAKECGFSVPASMNAQPNNINVTKINYPCIVKPNASIHGGKNITICHTKQELEKALLKYNPDYNILVQEYIHKEYEIVILGLSMKDKTIIPGFIEKHREEKGGTTYSTTRPISNLDPLLVKACQDLIDKIRYQGLWGIECIKQDNKHFFIELNMRNDATTYSIKVAGVNLPYLYLQSIEKPNFIPANISISTINSMVEFNDFNFVLKKKIGLFKWLKEYKNAECKYYYSVEDPKPYQLKKREYIRFIMNRIFHF